MTTLEPQTRDLEALRAFRVRDAMHVGVIKCPRYARLTEVARLMATHRVHAIVAVDTVSDDEVAPLWGVISDLDLVSLLATGDGRQRTAGDAATTGALLIAPGDTLERAAQLLREHEVTHLVVVEPATARPVGVLSTLDIAGVFAGVKPKHDPSAMRVENIMSREVATVPPTMPLKEVAKLLIDRGISGVPVVEDGKLLGVVSERDLLAKERPGVAKPDRLLGWILGEDPDAEKHWARTAGEAMTSPAVTIEAWRSTSSAAGLMAEHGLKRLPVVRDGRMVGIVTRRDLVRAFARPDDEIQRDIEEQVILRSFWLPPASIRVRVRNGEVTLSGDVEGEATHMALPAEVARVPGVVSVESRLHLGPAEPMPSW